MQVKRPQSKQGEETKVMVPRRPSGVITPKGEKLVFFFPNCAKLVSLRGEVIQITSDPVKLLPILYEAAADRTHWPEFLQGLAAQLNARVATLISRDEETNRCTIALQAGVTPEAQQVYMSYYGAIDAFYEFAQRRGFNYPGSIAPSQAFVSDKELLTTEYCNDFLLRYEMFHHCFSLFGKNGVALTNLSAIRSIREEPFEEPELAIMRFLAPHVEQAIRLDERFNRLRMESEAKSTALDSFALGVVFLDGAGRVLGANEAAEAIFAEGDGICNCKGRLRASAPAEDKSLQNAIFRSCQTGAARGTGAGGALLISRRSPRKPLQIVVGAACTGLPALSLRPAAVVFIHDLSARIRPRSSVLKELYGFTPAESRLACLILDGKSSEEITELLGISRNTFKTQLKSIFSKASVRRQSELVRLLLLLPCEPLNARNQS